MNKHEELRKALHDARAISDLVEKEGRDFSSEEKTQVTAFMEDAKRLKGEIQAEKTTADENAALKAAILGFELPDGGGPGDQRGTQGLPALKGTIGERFVNSPQFKGWMKQVAPNGRIPDSMKGIHSPAVQFRNFKDLITGSSDTSAGAFVETDYTRIVELLGRYPLNVLGLISMRTTGSDLVHFVQQTSKVQQAAMVPEANVTDYTGATGEVSGEKPEGTTAFLQVTEPVKTIAVWIPATKRALSDAAQLRGLIDQELVDDLNEEKEDQVLNGDGTGENFTGILNTAGILVQAWDTDLLTTIRRARTNLEVNGLSTPTGIVIHPNDIETLDLLVDLNGRFYFGGPSTGGPQMVWRVPVVSSQSITEGTGLMGDFRKAVMWDREQANISVSDSHEDFFIRNMVAILAEMRAAFGVIRPTGFCTVEMDSGS